MIDKKRHVFLPGSKQKLRVSRRLLGLGKIDQETRMEQISARLPFCKLDQDVGDVGGTRDNQVAQVNQYEAASFGMVDSNCIILRERDTIDLVTRETH